MPEAICALQLKIITFYISQILKAQERLADTNFMSYTNTTSYKIKSQYETYLFFKY